MKDAFYFPHDTNAIQDPKMMILLRKGGLAGVAFFWIIIEILHQQENGKMTIQEFESYKDFYCTIEHRGTGLFDVIVQTLFDTQLLLKDEKYVFNRRVLGNKKIREQIHEKRSMAGKISASKRLQSTSVQHLSTPVERESTKENKIKERKVNKDSLVKAAPSPQPPDKPMTDIQKVVTVFKVVSGFKEDDKGWDKMHFARCAKSAKSLIEFCGNWKAAGNCIQDIYERLSSKGLTVTMETICKHSAGWIKDQREKEAGHGVLFVQGNGSV